MWRSFFVFLIMPSFSSIIQIIGANPYVSLPDKILHLIFNKSGKYKGPIPVSGKLNEKEYRQTLVKYAGEWRLYINTTMLKNSPKRIGEKIKLSIDFDPADRSIKAPPKFLSALKNNRIAKERFEKLAPSRKKEIIRYLANLKTEKSLERNIVIAIKFLNGHGRFVGRDHP
jgi:hypothetical protein